MKLDKAKIKKEKADRLRAAREAVYRNRTEAARKLGVDYNTYKSHEYGDREFSAEDAARYAKAFGAPINHLLALDLIDSNFSKIIQPVDAEVPVHILPVYGHAAGGMWLEGDDVPLDEEIVSIAPQAGYPAQSQYARRVVGNSISNRIQNGEYAVMVRLQSLGRPLRHGELVDCQRVRGGLYEHSIKEFHGDSLMTNSAELSRQVAIPLDAKEEDTIVEILGVVIAAVRANP